MEIISKLNYLRISPRKVRLVADLIRYKRVDEAERILKFTPKRAAKSLAKLLKSAVSNARHNFKIEGNNLYIAKIFVNEGPIYKRWMPRSRGLANPIRKRTSHITLVLGKIKEADEREKNKRREKIK